MQVQEIMTANPVCGTADMRLQDIARLMRDNDCGEIPIVDDSETRRLIGVVTDRDIATRAVAEGKSPTNTQVSEVMSSSVITTSLNSDLDQACELMEKHQVRRLPVVDNEGRCRGILAQADIALRGKERKTGAMVKDVSRPHSGQPRAHL